MQRLHHLDKVRPDLEAVWRKEDGLGEPAWWPGSSRHVDIEQTFAPTSIMVLPKMLIHMMLNVFKDFVAMTLDVKDAFLMASPPEDDKAFVEVHGKIYKLVRCLPHPPTQRQRSMAWSRT